MASIIHSISSRRTLACGFAAALFSSIDPISAHADVERAIAIRNVRLENPGDAPKDGVTVVVRDGVVRAVGADAVVPPDALVLDGSGLTVVPAFLDAWSLAASAEPPKREVKAPARPVDEGVTVRMDPDSRIGRTPEAEVELAFPWQEGKKWREAGFGACLAVPLGTGMRGSSRVAWWVEEEATADEATLSVDVFQHVDLSISGPGYPSTTMGVLAAYRQFLADAERNAAIAARYEKNGRRGERPAVDRSFAALLSARERGQPFAVRADTKEAIRTALGLCAEFGVKPVIAGGAEAAETIAELKAAGAVVLLAIDFPKKPDEEEPASSPTDDVDQRGHCDDCCTSGAHSSAHAFQDPAPIAPAEPDQDASKPDDTAKEGAKEGGKDDKKKKRPELPAAVIAEREADRTARIGTAKALHEAGVPFALCAKDLKSPGDFRKNLKLALDAGLPREVAMAALTSDAAKILGVGDVLGRVDEGRTAALTAWRGDPLDPDSKVRWMVLGRERFEFELPKEQKAKEGEKPIAAGGTNVTGAWSLRIDMGDSAREYQLTFDQKDGRLSGNTLSASGSSGEITAGSVTGDVIEFTIVIAPAGRHYEFVYTGKVGGDSMSGSVAINGGEAHPWSASRVATPKAGG